VSKGFVISCHYKANIPALSHIKLVIISHKHILSQVGVHPNLLGLPSINYLFKIESFIISSFASSKDYRIDSGVCISD
jgi:hypothetical protein